MPGFRARAGRVRSCLASVFCVSRAGTRRYGCHAAQRRSASRARIARLSGPRGLSNIWPALSSAALRKRIRFRVSLNTAGDMIGLKGALVAAFGIVSVLGSGSVSADPAGKCGYYTNSQGIEVPRPCGSWRSDPTPPPTATARCRDGSWSWSRHPGASLTCSYHGGVESRVTR